MIKYGYSEKWKKAETETWRIDKVILVDTRDGTFGGLWGAPREAAWRCQICIAITLGTLVRSSNLPNIKHVLLFS